MFVWETTRFIISKYKTTIGNIEKLFTQDYHNYSSFLECKTQVESNLVTLDKCVKLFNAVLGKYILSMMIVAFVAVVTFFHYYINSFEHRRLDINIGSTVLNILLVMFSVIVILSCDRVEKKAEELIKTCIYIQASTGDENALALANLVKELRPKFSAAGFFDINQRILPSFFSNLSTYLIIILQFKLSSL
ncbi:uncharacterized protein LOC130899724 isoform X3 [Diorhabda carinulata]|uniref:uncharacterized protein LOC130899724 isoform X3 n=1 Tax=Diorhabda carinulata TaxID=1163345 RepID=UPI0025A28667|nr:uncharacterized protein LOC130899724 isoform X3 [Diorhabda carinulata]